MSPRADRPPRNLSGINFERSERQSYRPNFFVRMIAIVLTLGGILIVVWLLFNPVRSRPTTAGYVAAFNRIAAAQGMADRLGEPASVQADGSRDYPLTGTGLRLRIGSDAEGYVTALAISDDPAVQPEAGWLKLAPVDLRDRFAVMLDALDSKWTVVGLYRAFNAMGIDLDQPLAAQAAGTHEYATAGLNLRLTNDSRHVSFEALLDILLE